MVTTDLCPSNALLPYLSPPYGTFSAANSLRKSICASNGTVWKKSSKIPIGSLVFGPKKIAVSPILPATVPFRARTGTPACVSLIHGIIPWKPPSWPCFGYSSCRVYYHSWFCWRYRWWSSSFGFWWCSGGTSGGLIRRIITRRMGMGRRKGLQEIRVGPPEDRPRHPIHRFCPRHPSYRRRHLLGGICFKRRGVVATTERDDDDRADGSVCWCRRKTRRSGSRRLLLYGS